VFKPINMLGTSELFANTTPEEVGKRKLFVVLSSDKGLCGGIHSSVSKATRAAVKEADPESPVMIVGDKSKAQLSRSIPQNIALTFNQIGRDIPTFADAAAVADLIFKSGAKYDSIVIMYNKFVSALSFEASSIEVQTETSLREAREWTPL
jgi:F-type H+-transporting ATPase subunit gamma